MGALGLHYRKIAKRLKAIAALLESRAARFGHSPNDRSQLRGHGRFADDFGVAISVDQPVVNEADR